MKTFSLLEYHQGECRSHLKPGCPVEPPEQLEPHAILHDRAQQGAVLVLKGQGEVVELKKSPVPHVPGVVSEETRLQQVSLKTGERSAPKEPVPSPRAVPGVPIPPAMRRAERTRR